MIAEVEIKAGSPELLGRFVDLPIGRSKASGSRIIFLLSKTFKTQLISFPFFRLKI